MEIIASLFVNQMKNCWINVVTQNISFFEVSSEKLSLQVNSKKSIDNINILIQNTVFYNLNNRQIQKNCILMHKQIFPRSGTSL